MQDRSPVENLPLETSNSFSGTIAIGILGCKHLPRMTESEKLLKRHKDLIHSEDKKVATHGQRQSGDWIINTLTLEDSDVPFKYKRKKMYRSLVGARVNLTYYATTEPVIGVAMEVMNIVRIKRS